MGRARRASSRSSTSTACTCSGGVAVLLPPQPRVEAAAAAVLDGLDGLILTGGLDVAPRAATARSGIRRPTPPARTATRGSSPCCAAPKRAGCRSSASAAGCSSSTSRTAARCTSTCPTPSAPSGTASAAASSRRTRQWWMTARGSPGSSAPARSTCTATTTRASSSVGDGLVVTARTDDDLVYAFEAPGDRYLVAVQWHPEQNSEDRRLFAGLVAAASVYADARRAPFFPGGARVSFTVINPATATPLQEVARASVAEVDEAVVARRRGAAPVGGARAGRTRRRAALASRGSSRRTSSSSPGSRSRTPGTRSARRGGRPATSPRCSTTTPAPPSGSRGARSRWPAGSM